MPQYFSGLAQDKRKLILESEILVYECEGTESEIKEWFRTINIVGLPLNDQELLNAVFSGPFVTLGKSEFSNSNNANIDKWSAYISGVASRQDFWERALEWVSKDKESIGLYMSEHRNDTNINEVKTYFNTVIDWASSIFMQVEKEMRGLDWGRFYETYHSKAYSAAEISIQVQALYADPYVRNRKGIFEYVLGGSVDKKLLEIRFFDEATKRSTFEKQTQSAKRKKISNCPNCAIGNDVNKSKLWTIAEMDADHVTPWSKGGATTVENCEMLCKTHNRAKGNR
jgi:hypothetical protein